MVKRPSVIGFRPNLKEIQMVQELLEHFQKENEIGEVTTSDVIKKALHECHKKYIDKRFNPTKRYGLQ